MNNAVRVAVLITVLIIAVLASVWIIPMLERRELKRRHGDMDRFVLRNLRPTRKVTTDDRQPNGEKKPL